MAVSKTDKKWTRELLEQEEVREFQTIQTLVDKLIINAGITEQFLDSGNIPENETSEELLLEGLFNYYYQEGQHREKTAIHSDKKPDGDVIKYSVREVEDARYNICVAQKELDILKSHINYLEKIRMEMHLNSKA